MQTMPNGETRTMGSDGGLRWSIRGNGPVRVSQDPARFSGATAYDRQGLTFLDLRTQLAELRDHYQLEWRPAPSAPQTSPALQGLHGFRQSAAQGGAKELEVWFDPATGLIHRIILSGLPRGGGGPARIALELTSTAPLPPGFFSHEAHHKPDRPVEAESSNLLHVGALSALHSCPPLRRACTGVAMRSRVTGATVSDVSESPSISNSYEAISTFGWLRLTLWPA
jgi:hypothetical protein